MSLLPSAEQAKATVVGAVRDPTRIDAHGYKAILEVERVLAGHLGGAEMATIGWEEFSPERGSRLADGERIVAALEPLPGGSLWRGRFAGARAYALGASGAAYLSNPDADTLDRLAAYLALDPEAREQEPGVTALARLAAGAHPLVGESAVQRLETFPGLAGRVSTAATQSLARALASDGRPRELRERVLQLAARRGLSALRPAIEPLATPGSELEAPALAALAQLDGGLAAQQVARLLERSEEPVRLVAVVHGADAIPDERLASMLVRDPGPKVRGAALTVLLRRRGLDALDAALPALFDAVPSVRGDAALQIAALGPEAVPILASLIPTRTAEELTGVFSALHLIGGIEATRVLAETARDHPDDQVRKMALVALGRLPRH